MDPSKVKIAYTTTERNGRTFWNRIGVAFLNKDGSMNVRLESLPVSGEMHIRDLVPRELSTTTPDVQAEPQPAVDAAQLS
jgi:hypothetical protein